MYNYVYRNQESIVAISLTLNTQNDCFKIDLAIFGKNNDILSNVNLKKCMSILSFLVFRLLT